MSKALVLRVLLAAAVVLTMAHIGARDVAQLLLPMLREALAVVADDFSIQHFELTQERANTTIGALAVQERTLFLGGQAIVPDGQQVVVASTTVGTVMQPLLVLAVLVLAWPARLLEFIVRLGVAAGAAMVVLLLDTPFSLAAWLWDVQLKMYEPGSSSPLLWWNVFLNGGGRLALGLVAAAFAITLAQHWTTPSRPPQPGR
ncbi:hypothetical protein [Piscinibacter sp. HJYY11]|uniref:hypothetical protein n=1 Tax=Piscinibacter sp. HJYY11 TaxID=2801333 RepID=UPI00191E1D4A|nr:hypothetical protein [Piscinibacter sp. HJYY11]MBL0726205.1 hypothetical protein [Piscinibacter sp. HJYY11]